MVQRGDFEVGSFSADRVEEYHEERTENAQRSDEAKRSPVTTSYQAWRSNPGQLDYPGVDTPTDDPKVYPKDVKDEHQTSVNTRETVQTQEENRPVPSSAFGTGRNEAELSQQDISLAPEEAFDGVAATSSREIGGFDASRGGETSPTSEPSFFEETSGESLFGSSDDTYSDIDPFEGVEDPF